MSWRALLVQLDFESTICVVRGPGDVATTGAGSRDGFASGGPNIILQRWLCRRSSGNVAKAPLTEANVQVEVRSALN